MNTSLKLGHCGKGSTRLKCWLLLNSRDLSLGLHALLHLRNLLQLIGEGIPDDLVQNMLAKPEWLGAALIEEVAPAVPPKWTGAGVTPARLKL